VEDFLLVGLVDSSFGGVDALNKEDIIISKYCNHHISNDCVKISNELFINILSVGRFGLGANRFST